MGFHCIGCEGKKCENYIKKDAKAGDLMSIACCQNCGLVQLNAIPSEKDLFEFYESKYRFQYRKEDKPSSKHVYRAGAMAVKLANSRLKNKNLIEYVFNGGLLKIFKRVPQTAQERYFSRGKDPKKILDSLLIREKLVEHKKL